ncbi:Serine/threonine protein kinase [Streptomyces sp. LamerLS-316]|uniref:serine/threonine-protein kinase n=1 Tax=unclassified Streptomyces TaxID=2593676 RepID=UPI000823D85F|nr:MULTISPECIES: serine/threonine-protein kinase [unclassified Streptomyces]MYQ42027.1 protein kinase [Streptomyces sp. SID4921]SCK29935.1 Serine/threonine protein kinase [Streptomyces sp. LamerLS-316]
MEKLGSGDPQRIGSYRLLGRLGAGGMGQVFLARSDRGRTVALKLVRPELAEQQHFRDRFRAEVRAARQVGGSWTAPVLDAGVDAAVPWVATGYVAGPSLHRIVSGRPGAPVTDSGAYGPLPERSVRILGAGLAGALQDIHRAGLIHRDLKPSNVLMTIDGPRVIDFGIARALDTVADGGLTRTGAMIGSPGFMSPEQVRGERVTTACDVFCLGAVLAYASTGRLPFGSADTGAHALMYRIAQEEPDLTGVPVDLVELIQECLAKDPAARPSTDAVLERLGDTDTAEPWLPGALIAQLGRHAVELLDAEDPEDPEAPAEPGPAASGPAASGPTASGPTASGPAGGPQAAPVPPVPPAPSRPTPPTPAPRPAAPYPGPTHPRPPVPQAAPPPRAYGYPQQPSPAYGYGPTPPYGPSAGYAPPQPGRRRAMGSSLALIAVALLVAVGAGWGVYAFMRGGDGDPTAHPSGTASPSGGGSSGGEGSGGTDGKGAGSTVPSGFLGTWTGTIESGGGASTRQLVVRQGEVGDTVMSLTAEGPLDTGGSYRCVFEADLASEPSSGGPVRIGPSRVVEGAPKTSCTPGEPTVLTLLPDGTLRRQITSTGQSLTYTKTG